MNAAAAPSVKQKVDKAMDALPKYVSFEGVIERLVFLEKIEIDL